MSLKLGYVIKFVAEMDKAVAFYRDTLGLKLRFESPEWSEFETGETTLALHRATPEKPAGSCELGFNIGDIAAEHAALAAKGVNSSRRLQSNNSAVRWRSLWIAKARASPSAANRPFQRREFLETTDGHR